MYILIICDDHFTFLFLKNLYFDEWFFGSSMTNWKDAPMSNNSSSWSVFSHTSWLLWRDLLKTFKEINYNWRSYAIIKKSILSSSLLNWFFLISSFFPTTFFLKREVFSSAHFINLSYYRKITECLDSQFSNYMFNSTRCSGLNCQVVFCWWNYAFCCWSSTNWSSIKSKVRSEQKEMEKISIYDCSIMNQQPLLPRKTFFEYKFVVDSVAEFSMRRWS